MPILPLPINMISTQFDQQLAQKTPEEVSAIARDLYRQLWDLKIQHHRELSVAYGLVPALEVLG
jgi:hypothetical protein